MKKIIKKRRTPKNDVGFRTKNRTLKDIGWEPWFFDTLNETFCNDIYNLDDNKEDSLGVS
jgi:hypothetical protein|tara:strand:+ start:1621 stop:1800 length:180 start_codon:yes stop_codon:yes gene_type:complete